MASVALRTPEECLEAWRYIRPYAEGVQGDRRALARLQGAVSFFPGLHISMPHDALCASNIFPSPWCT